jgi:hypothetical protein
MSVLRRLRQLGENNLALKLFALALATLLYFAVRPAPGALAGSARPRVQVRSAAPSAVEPAPPSKSTPTSSTAASAIRSRS